MKVIFSGLESSGKSLKLAMQAEELVFRNARWFKMSGVQRPIWSNLKFSDKFVDFAKAKHVPIFYWHDLDDLIKIRDADIIIDEVGTYFDSRVWADLSIDVRRFLQQAAKIGVEMYGSAQDFAQVDKSFRRLVNNLYHIRKLIGSGRPAATKPPIKYIWGLCMVSELDPQGYDEDKKKFTAGAVIPNFFLITRDACEIFDTTQQIERSAPPRLKHIDRFCESPNCAYHKIQHV